jgi:hypothetical protein
MPYKDALVAIASVSAVLWTGGLIVFQLRQSERDAGRSPTFASVGAMKGGWAISKSAQAKAGSPNRIGALDSVRAGMAATAFGALAPLFALFICGVTLRVTAGIGFGLYFVYTIGNWRNLWRALSTRPLDRRGARNAIVFLLPTIAMLVVAVFATNYVIAWVSTVLAFIGYYVFFDQMLSSN